MSRAVEMLNEQDRQALRITMMLTDTKAWEHKAAIKALRNRGLVSNAIDDNGSVEGETHWKPKPESRSKGVKLVCRLAEKNR